MRRALVALIAIGLIACGTKPAPPPEKPPARVGPVMRGQATWYGRGQRTASGERFNPNALTAAHRTLPFGTRVRVTHERNGKSVVVRINDRGPFGSKRRIIDLSRAAAARIGMISQGVATVRLEVLSRPGRSSPQARRKGDR